MEEKRKRKEEREKERKRERVPKDRKGESKWKEEERPTLNYSKIRGRVSQTYCLSLFRGEPRRRYFCQNYVMLAIFLSRTRPVAIRLAPTSFLHGLFFSFFFLTHSRSPPLFRPSRSFLSLDCAFRVCFFPPHFHHHLLSSSTTVCSSFSFSFSSFAKHVSRSNNRRIPE